MLFNSYIFILCFLPLSVTGYYVLRHRGWHRAALGWLAASSFLFYAYDNVSYLPVLLGSIAGNWTVAYLMNRTQKERIRRGLLLLGILLNVGSIFYFKYFDFFLENCNRLLKMDLRLRNILLPLGISFFTFQQISYLVDSYRGETKDYRFLEYMTFVSFFPQLVAGPIVLHSELIPQFRDKERWHLDQDRLAHGLYLFSMGLFRKVILADTFGNAVSWAWASLEALSSLELILVMLSYTFQIYFDFSGYCDMAMGIAQMFGMELPVNFNSPYKAVSILDFWKRWHMTLTRFLRNYIYFPLGGSRKGSVRTYINIMIVFLISGIWHGADWTFVLWGALHGLAQVLNRIFQRAWDRLPRCIRWSGTFLFVSFMWLIFRAEGLQQALFLFQRIFAFDSFRISEGLLEAFALPELEALAGWALPQMAGGLYMWIFLAGSFLSLRLRGLHEKAFRPTVLRAVGSALLLIWCVVSFAGVSTFLYFDF